MVHVTPFVLDNFDTCVDPLSFQGLAQLGDTSTPIKADAPIIYGPSAGNTEIRERILELYSNDVADPTELSLTVTQGTIAANFLVLDTLVGPRDHVVCQYPTYQQLYDVPRRAGAEVTLWRTSPENNWIPDVKQLASLVKDNTKIIIINNPNNPTGASIPTGVLEDLVAFAAERDIIILADEVFRPLFHSPSETNPPSIISFAGRYKNIIATSSVSKGFSLPGIRLGWIISPNPDLIHQASMAKDYTTISVSQIDQELAAFALNGLVRAKIIQRSLDICGRNLAALEHFVDTHPKVLSWVKPTGAASAFVCVLDEVSGAPVDDVEFCIALLQKTGLFIVPGGKTFGTEAEIDFKGYLRVGFVCAPEKFDHALKLWGEYFEQTRSRSI
ncbi:aspartate aminotransferase [Penicillium chermesinum]|uniref:Aspartate aminotransferase n=1 Tax=Penicillium chermesinum TaxID=63820 RepID=A0A9W9NWI2_9EURO|nr:aspartate aminotransferase [Penicillium chermesinum]KAJ5225954.1 aspartate aminotransferase [Penicillium chermesinum]